MANIKIAELTTSSIELNENQVANIVGGSGFRRRRGGFLSINDSFNKQLALNYSDVTQINLGYGGNSAYVSQYASNTIY